MDEPGSWHHVMNRGVARRTVFEHAADVRRFQMLLALEVRVRRIEVHAFAFLATHFHLLLRSVHGELSGCMRRIEREVRPLVQPDPWS